MDMTDAPVQTYKGHSILVTPDGEFYALKGGEGYGIRDAVTQGKTLDAVRKKLNDVTKANLGQRVFIDVWTSDDTHIYSPGTVKGAREQKSRHTGPRWSYTVEYMKLDVPKRDGKGYETDTETLSAASLVKDTPENRERMKAIMNLRRNLKEMEKRLETLDEQLETFTDSELLNLNPKPATTAPEGSGDD